MEKSDEILLYADDDMWMILLVICDLHIYTGL